MSDYPQPSYEADPLQGHQAPAGGEGYGDEAVYGDYGTYEEPAYGDQGAYAEDVAYGDGGSYTEDVAYGDQGAYGEDVAYGDQGAYAEDVAYGDAGAYGEETSFADGYQAEAYDEPAETFDQDYAEEDDDLEEAQAPLKPRPDRKKLLIGSAVGLALIGMMGAGGYFFLLAPQEEGASFDLGGIMRMIPFLSPQESEETRAANQANVMAVKKAIDMFAKKNGRLPISAEEVEAQLRSTGWELSNPYNLEAPITLEYAEVPTAPGAVAFVQAGDGYTVRVGDVEGAPLALEGEEYVVRGQAPAIASQPPMAPPQGKRPAAAKPPAATPVQTAAKPPAATPAPAEPEPEEAAFEDEPAPAPKPTATPARMSPAQRQERNREFDHWRNRGIALVYEQRTAEAVVAFKKALAIRPGDATATRWLKTIQGVIDEHAASEKAKYKAQSLQLKPQPHHAPALPPDPVRAAEEDTRDLLEQLKRRAAERPRPEGAPDLPAPRLE
ncbi:MAG: hypothetical protein ACLGIN_01675 [Candidatus Sericytochromatia bacterium]